jgi:FkbM family methyltransferase
MHVTGTFKPPIFMKESLRSTYRGLKSLVRRFRGLDFTPSLSPSPFQLKHLGTAYGGWVFADTGYLDGSVLVSAGLGEDASFDVEFVTAYRARAILVDPTPRAVNHYNALIGRTGQPKVREYTHSGEEPVEAYDLRSIGKSNLVLCSKALWKSSESVRFYAPPNESHVSHSIVDLQNQGACRGSYLDVAATTLADLMTAYGISRIDVLKLDIEGAESEVLDDMLRTVTRPIQVLVEYDELIAPSKKSLERVRAAHASLTAADYLLLSNVGTNFSYIRSDAI